MADSAQLISPETGIAEEKETILIVGSEGRQVDQLQRELQSSGYPFLTAAGSAEAITLLSSRRVQLVIVNVCGSGRVAMEGEPKQIGPSAEKQDFSKDVKELESYQLCRTVKTAAAAGKIPVLLISSLWSESALVRGLGTGADYYLFAPYQPADLLRAIRESLLNGLVEEPDADHLSVEVVHQDRTHLVTAGRSRLARLGFSIFEELRQCRAALSWSQAEAQELRQKLRQERKQRQQSQRAFQSPAVVQGIAHDFSNLLETVGAAATVLRSDPPQPKPYRDALDAALAQAGVLLATLQKWTEWDGEEAQENIEAVDVALIAQEVLEAALLPLRAPKIHVRMQLHGLPPVSASQPLVMRILSNLVWNAVEAMPNGGRLSLLGYLQRNRMVLEVSDTGVGISKSDQEKIFQGHYSTKPGHAGMGLLVVRNLIVRAGGDITFVSNPGRGSTFALSFPVASHRPAGAPTVRAGGRKVIAS